jgi:hypothetical protein
VNVKVNVVSGAFVVGTADEYKIQMFVYRKAKASRPERWKANRHTIPLHISLLAHF